MRICNVKDCNNKHRWHGYCVNHARAFDKYGDPLAKHKRFHGGTGTPEYEVWRGMKQRCYLKSSPYYSFYGARGIKVCDRWLNSYPNFLKDVGRRPSDKHTLDRIDGNGNYEPTNVKWATRKEQSNNIRSNIHIEYDGRIQTIAEWADEYNMEYYNLYNRLCRYGWTVERALTEPLHWQ